MFDVSVISPNALVVKISRSGDAPHITALACPLVNIDALGPILKLQPSTGHKTHGTAHHGEIKMNTHTLGAAALLVVTSSAA